MQEILEQVLDYLKGIWLKRRYIMIATWLICPIGWFYVASLDDIYESNARIYADTQSILRPLLKGITVENNPDIQIQLMVKTLLSRNNLERISRMTDLDVQAQTPEAYEDLIDNLKNGIEIRKIGNARSKDNIFTIAYEHKNPEMARNVVQSALTVFIENTLGENRNDSDTAQKFLDSQIKEYEDRLQAAEARLTDFKQRYSNVLPNQYGGYYTKLSNAKELLRSLELNLLETETQLETARSQLAKPSTSNEPSNKIMGSSIQTTYDERISELETKLDSLLLGYTEQHPDIIEVKRRLEHLNKQRSKEIEKFLQTQTDDDSGVTNLSDNPVIQSLQIQVNQLENQVASFNVRVKNQKAIVDDLENKIHTLPEIEAELIGLNRGYEITKAKYEDLLQRKETATIAQQADETTNKIEFRVIDPPRASTVPSGPKRLLFFMMVTVVGLGAGVGLSLLFSQISPVVTSSSQIAKATGIPVFGVVSATENLGLQAWHKRKKIVFIISNLLLLMMFSGFMAFFLFPDLVQAPLRRFL